jgi:hypothetical protein
MTQIIAMLDPAERVDNRVVWQTSVPGGQVVTVQRGDRFATRIIQEGGELDGWEDSASSIRQAQRLHDGLVAMARGAAERQRASA